MPQVFALGAAIFAGTAIAWTTCGDGTNRACFIASLFMSKEIDVGDNSPTYAFGP